MKNILSFTTAAQWLWIIIFILEISLRVCSYIPKINSKLQKQDLNSGIMDRLLLVPALPTMPSWAPAVRWITLWQKETEMCSLTQ